MPRPLKVLIAEDNLDDAELLVRRLRQAGYEPNWTRVDTEADYLAALGPTIDIVLSDYVMPQFNGLRALELLKKSFPETPFIVISGTIGEETAVAAMKLGATDYLLKDRLARLPQAIDHALEQGVRRAEQRHSAQALVESERRYREMFEHNAQPMWVYDRESLRFLAVNDAALHQYGYTREEFLAMTIDEIRPPEEVPHLMANLAETAPMLPNDRVWLHRRKDGSQLHVAISSHDVPFDGRPGRLVMASDETARRQAEAELRASEERLRMVTENARVGLVMLDTDRRYTFANATYAEILDLPQTNLVGRKVAEVLSGLYEGQIAPRLDRAFAGERVTYELFQPSAAQTRYYSVRYEPMHRHGRVELVVVVITEITERKAAEEALRSSEERFRQLADTIDEVFWMTDPAKQEMLFVSRAYEKVWGRTCESLYAAPLTWAEAIHPEDRLRVLAVMKAKQASGDYDETYRIVRPDGAVRWIHDRAYPVRDAAGAVFRVAGVAQDVTETKQLEAQFFRAQRLESIGTLASGIAHDLNNILAPIMMSAQMIRQTSNRAETEVILATVEGSAQRGAQLIRQLLTFGRGIEGEKRALALGTLITEMESIARQTFPRNISIAIKVQARLWPIFGDPTQIHQMLLNLCVNARDAMPDGGRLTLSAENVRLDEGAVAMRRGMKAGDYVMLSVIDTGTGMTAEVIDKIFDPFFTTKAEGKGTGLGLATVLGLVKSHQGFLTLTSEPGKGTVFLVYLPALLAPAVEVARGPEAAVPDGSGQLVLVVDDEAGIREALEVTLMRHGYRVLVAEDGERGLAVFSRAREKIELVVSDLDMPKLDGIEMLRRMREAKPGLRFIVSSGVSSGQVAVSRKPQIRSLGVWAILAKPYAARELLVAVHQAVTAPPGAEPPPVL